MVSLKNSRKWNWQLKVLIVMVVCCLIALNASPSRAKMYTGIGNAVWSPDGKKIAFTFSDTNTESNTMIMNALYVMGVNGGKPLKLVDGNVETFAWSPDSTQIAYSGTTSSGISVIDVAKRSTTLLTKLGRWPTWTADGETIKYLNQAYDLYAMAMDGSNPQQVADQDATLINLWSVEWSPDRSAVAFVSPQSKQDEYGLYVFNADGLRELEVARDISGPLAWSPDGTQLVATGSCGGKSYALCIHNLTSGEKQFLSVGWLPAWSPDGTHIAFAKDSQLCLVNSDGTGERCVTEKQVNAAMTVHAWSPDSRYVLVSRAFMPDSNAELYRMDYTTLIVNVEADSVRRWFDAFMVEK